MNERYIVNNSILFESFVKFNMQVIITEFRQWIICFMIWIHIIINRGRDIIQNRQLMNIRCKSRKQRKIL